MLSLRWVPLHVALLFCCQAFAATMTVGQSDGHPGETAVSVPLTLNSSPGDIVAALQTDAKYDPNALTVTSISSGPSATAANKTVSFSTQTPGIVRLIVAGLNQNAISDGVVAIMVFDIAQGASTGVQTIQLAGALAADPTGSAVPIETTPGSITITTESSEGEGESEARASTCCFGGTLSPGNCGRKNLGDLLMYTIAALAILQAAREIEKSRY